jgi:hypothetical protein
VTQPAKTRKVILPNPDELRLQIKYLVKAMEHGERLLAKAEIAYEHHADELGVKASKKVHSMQEECLKAILAWLSGQLTIASTVDGRGRHNALLETLEEEEAAIQRYKAVILGEIEKSLL